MKKLFSLIFLGAIAVACTKDDPNSLDATLETAAITTTSSTINFEAVNPITEVPNRAFDNTSNGIYHGIIVSQDVSVHGKIWINIANNGDYNATVVTEEGNAMAFFGIPTSRSQEIITFKGKEGSFVFDVTEFDNPKATDVTINGISGYIQTVKDRSVQRATATLGNYADLNDATFSGTWDLLTDGTTNGTAFGLPALTQVCILSPFGTMYIDDTFEPFSWPWFDLDGDGDGDDDDITTAVYLNESGLEGGINEFWAMDQSLDINGFTLNYWLGQSSFLSQGNDPGPVDDVSDTGFFNHNIVDVLLSGAERVNGRNTASGIDNIKALWTWNGRTGFATFNDEFDGMPPTRNQNLSIDYKGLQNEVLDVENSTIIK